MANLTFADYISEIYGYMNEARDRPETNRKIRLEDVKAALNRGRHRMLRKVGMGMYRSSAVMNAAAGDLTPPADFFNQALVHYKAPGSQSPVLLTQVDAKAMDQSYPGWRTQAAGTPTKIVWDIQPTVAGSATVARLVARLHPQPASTVANGLTWYYSARLGDLVEDTDTCPIMDLFPEFQMTTLQAGALRILYLLEGGEADDQFAKWDKIFERDIEEIRASVKTLFCMATTMVGKNL